MDRVDRVEGRGGRTWETLLPNRHVKVREKQCGWTRWPTLFLPPLLADRRIPPFCVEDVVPSDRSLLGRKDRKHRSDVEGKRAREDRPVRERRDSHERTVPRGVRRMAHGCSIPGSTCSHEASTDLPCTSFHGPGTRLPPSLLLSDLVEARRPRHPRFVAGVVESGRPRPASNPSTCIFAVSRTRPRRRATTSSMSAMATTKAKASGSIPIEPDLASRSIGDEFPFERESRGEVGWDSLVGSDRRCRTRSGSAAFQGAFFSTP